MIVYLGHDPKDLMPTITFDTLKFVNCGMMVLKKNKPKRLLMPSKKHQQDLIW